MKTRDVGKLFHVLISRLEDGSQLDSVALEISTVLREGGMAENVSAFMRRVVMYES